MRRLFAAALAVALAMTGATAAEVEFISPRDGLLTTDDTLVVIGRAERGRRLNWSVRRDGVTETDTVTANWGNLFEIFVMLGPGVNLIRVEDKSLQVFYDTGLERTPSEFRPQFVHATDLSLCEDCHDTRSGRLLDGGYPWVCFGCHLVVSSNPANPGEAREDRHFRTAVADCSRCHEAHVSADPKLLRAPTSNLCGGCHATFLTAPSTHRALETGGCAACHDPHFSGYPNSLHQRLPGLCQQCHDQGLKAGDAHPALTKDASCGTCHDSHGRGKGLLRDRPNTLCEPCHAKITRRGHGDDLAACDTCHDPHGVREANLLHAGAQEACRTCHSDVAQGPNLHAPMEDGCQTCHRPHADDNLAQARQSCAGCHDLKDDQALVSLHGNLNLAPATCGICHQPHASPLPGLLKGKLHSPLAQGKCSACHGGGSERSTVITEPVTRCRMCHDFETTLRAAGAQLHQPLLDGGCITCHNPHLSAQPSLLRATEGVLCRQCHDTPKVAVGKPLHGAGQPCHACHNPHGGYRGALLAPP